MDLPLQSANTPERRAVALFLSNGTEDSFSQVFAALYPKLVRFFRLRGCDWSSAEELADDVLSSVYRHSGALRERESFFGWLFHIAQNQLLQHIRRYQNKVETVCLSELMDAKPNSPARGQADFVHLIGSLDTVEQHLMTMRYCEGLSYKEISAALSLPLGTVKWKIFNAKAKLSAGLTP